MFKKEDIKIFICDFDGIFTDGKLTVYSDGRTSKQIDYKDIMAVANLLKSGIKFAVISGEKSAAIEVLKEKFPSIDIFQNERKKINVLKNLLDKYNLKPQNALYMGDDINDTECLNFVSFPVTVNNAHINVKSVKNIFITKNNGGCSAVREVADYLL
ncbi:MAG: HAD hydrolase family protein [Candidatus Gastranaerophilales bacterium]|nr:HAD hydrolase family protein [Candidatus Gastranaerophilales bacterium]